MNFSIPKNLSVFCSNPTLEYITEMYWATILFLFLARSYIQNICSDSFQANPKHK